jgi:integrating conjugative element protein (TIGR03761 family)
MTMTASIASHTTDRLPRPPAAREPDREAFHGTVSLAVHTRYGKGLITGRAAGADKPPIVGLLDFAERLRMLWRAAAADDPYADWWLIRIEAGLDRLRHAIADLRQRYQSVFEPHAALDIELDTDRWPYCVTLHFANPYSYDTANLVGEFDQLARRLLTAEQLGLLDQRAAHEPLALGAKRFRQLLTLPQRYRSLSINRRRLAADERLASAAVQTMGEIPADVLAGKRLPRLLPRRDRSVAESRPASTARPTLETR